MDNDEVMLSSRGKDDSIEKKRKGKYLRLTDKKIGGSMKKKMIDTHQSSTSSYSLDPQPSDKSFVRELGLALTAITRNQCSPVQVALQQFKLLSQSLNTRKNYGDQILDARITQKKEEFYKLEEQKIAMSYLDTKIKHGRLVSDACNSSHGFGNEFSQGNQDFCNIETDCGLKEDRAKAMNEGTIGCRKPVTGKASNTSPHSQERRKRKKRKIENQENHCDSSIPSHAVCSSSLPDGMTVEVLEKGKPDGKVASPGKQVKIYVTLKLKDSEDVVLSNIGGAPDILDLGKENTLKGLRIGIEGMHVGEKRRLTIPPSLGQGSKPSSPIRPDSWVQYDIELVDICE